MNKIILGIICGKETRRLPSAIIARAYAPIIGMGAIGGLIIGFVAR
ncbi:MAG: hypothetical protein ABH814_03055 [bacterium]